MKKKISMLLSALMCVIMVFSISGTKASAVEVVEPTNLEAFKSANAILSVNGENAASGLTLKIQELGIEVTDNSLIELVPVYEPSLDMVHTDTITTEIQASEKKYIYCVTNANGNTVTQDYIVMFEEKENNYDIISMVNNADAAPAAEEVSSWPKGRPLTVIGRIIFNVYYTDTFVPQDSPQACALTMTNVDAGKTCVLLTGVYRTYGNLYSYPELEWQKKKIEHTITVTTASPTLNKEYTRSDPLPLSTGVIHLNGDPFASRSYEIEYYIRGEDNNVTSGRALVIK